MKQIGLVVFAVLIFIVKAVMFGFVLMYLWQWFIMESFAVVALTYPQAISLIFVSRFLLLKGINSKEDEDLDYESLGKDFAHAVLYSILILGLGWLLSLLIFI